MYPVGKGIMHKPLRCVTYGVEGIGKSTFASHFPEPLFIDTEGSTKFLDVSRLPEPTSWTMLLDEVDYVIKTPGLCKTLVIDTIDWAEKLCINHVIASNQWKSLESPGYGAGYRHVYENFGKLLDKLSILVDNCGVNVLLTAHAIMRTVNLPDEMGSYDKWEMKLQSSQRCSICSMVKEWADLVLFAKYKTIVFTDEKSKKNKAAGGERVMYTTHHNCWDAKNRFGMPEELPFDFKYLEPVFIATASDPTPAPEPSPAPDPVPQPPKQEPEPAPADTALDRLQPLMIQSQVTPEDIQEAVTAQGFYPKGTKISEYNPAFIDGMLIANWGAVVETIKEMKDIPF